MRTQESVSFNNSDTKNIRCEWSEIRDRKDRDPRLAGRRVQRRADIERLAFEPGGEARHNSKLFNFMASANRSLAGKNDSMSTTPIFATGGVCVCSIRADRSRLRPRRRAVFRIVASKMCSRLVSGSTSSPTKVSNPVTVEFTRSPSRSASSRIDGAGAQRLAAPTRAFRRSSRACRWRSRRRATIPAMRSPS